MFFILFLIKGGELPLDANGLIKDAQEIVHALLRLNKMSIFRNLQLILRQLISNIHLAWFQLSCDYCTLLSTAWSLYLIELIVYCLYLAPEYLRWPPILNQRFCPQLVFLYMLQIEGMNFLLEFAKVKLLSLLFDLQGVFDGGIKPTYFDQAH